MRCDSLLNQPPPSSRRYGQALILTAVLWLAACAHVPTPGERADRAQQLAAPAAWQAIDIPAGDFTLRAYLPAAPRPAPILTVYLEGDGLAWIGSSTPSLDPTPLNPVGLKLALRDPAPAAYLARPCQYVGTQQGTCAQKYWTGQRFAPEVIRATDRAIGQLKQRFGADKLVLVGYSGGGAVAALVAARRQDVAQLITIAGNLDHKSWTDRQRLTPLTGSLNPADEWRALQTVLQRHYVGGRDAIVGEYVARAYAARFPASAAPEVIVVPEFDHHCCWVDRWPVLKNQAGSRHQ